MLTTFVLFIASSSVTVELPGTTMAIILGGRGADLFTGKAGFGVLIH